MKNTSISNEGMKVKMEYYRKDDKHVVLMKRNLNGEILKLSMCDNGEGTDVFTETSESKNVQLNKDNIMTINLYNFLETDNNWQTLLGSICARVKSTNYNGKECYVIKGFLSSTSLAFEGQETYIEKDTGLFVKTTGEGITEREYEFGNVDDSIFKL